MVCEDGISTRDASYPFSVAMKALPVLLLIFLFSLVSAQQVRLLFILCFTGSFFTERIKLCHRFHFTRPIYRFWSWP